MTPYPIQTLHLICVFLLLPVLGCHSNNANASKPTPTPSRPSLPPDFALQFHVTGDPSTNDPLRQTSYYVLQANRQLHVATGPTAMRRAYPPLARIITHAQYEELIGHTLRCHLMAEPNSPTGKSPDTSLRYEVVIIANGRTHRYATTPAESPPTVQLLQKIVKSRSTTTQKLY